MKTRITQNIDGYDIIIGIGEAQIDGVQTMPIVEIAIRETDEYKAVEAKKLELQPIAQLGIQAFRNAKESKTVSDRNLYTKEYQARLEESKVIETELALLYPALQEKQRELILKHAVYFTPKEGESIITDSQALSIESSMISATEKNMWLDINLKEICDYRAQTAWSKVSGKWQKREIMKIGETLKSGEVLHNNLSEIQVSEIGEQMEAERISLLTSSEKLAEKTSALQNLASRANMMRGELEVMGDAKALVKSQEWYKSESAKVEVKYS
jgi:hypothetical protein